MSSHRALVADLIESSCVDGPGNRFVVFLQGCNFDCLACHNPHTIPRLGGDACRWVDVDELVAAIRLAEPFISGVTVSGGEATVQWRFVVDLFEALADDPELAELTRLVDTNGEACTTVWDAIAPVMTGAMIDLKAFDPDVHVFLTARSNERVRRSIEYLAALDKVHEVRLLVIPGVNDRADDIAATAAWLASLDTDLRVRLIGFRHEGTRELAETFRMAEPEDLERVRQLLIDHGTEPDAISIASTTHIH